MPLNLNPLAGFRNTSDCMQVCEKITSHLMYDLSKQFHNELVVSLSSIMYSSPQLDAHLVNYGSI